MPRQFDVSLLHPDSSYLVRRRLFLEEEAARRAADEKAAEERMATYGTPYTYKAERMLDEDPLFQEHLPKLAAAGSADTRQGIRGQLTERRGELLEQLGMAPDRPPGSNTRVDLTTVPPSRVEMDPGIGEVERKVRRYAGSIGLDPDYAVAMARIESGLNQDAVSPKGARGVFQLMPKTAAGLGVDPSNLEQNIRGGVTYFRQMLQRFGGDVDRAVAAYNAGPGAVERYGGVPPYKETRGHVQKFQDALNKMRGGSQLARMLPGLNRPKEGEQLSYGEAAPGDADAGTLSRLPASGTRARFLREQLRRSTQLLDMIDAQDSKDTEAKRESDQQRVGATQKWREVYEPILTRQGQDRAINQLEEDIATGNIDPEQGEAILRRMMSGREAARGSRGALEAREKERARLYKKGQAWARELERWEAEIPQEDAANEQANNLQDMLFNSDPNSPLRQRLSERSGFDRALIGLSDKAVGALRQLTGRGGPPTPKAPTPKPTTRAAVEASATTPTDKVRLSGVDTPEMGTGPLSKVARIAFQRMLNSSDTTVFKTIDGDTAVVDTNGDGFVANPEGLPQRGKYNRALGTFMTNDGRNVQVELVREGLAEPKFLSSVAPSLAQQLKDAQRLARRDRRGMWQPQRSALQSSRY